jgi:DNA-binding transcriptional LysR family regulator
VRKSPDRLRATPDGYPRRDLLGPLERLLYDTEAIVDYAHDISGLKTGLVTVAALPTIAADLLPCAIEEYRRLYPGVRIAVQDVVADRVRELVVKRAADFGVGTAAKRDREIATKPLFHDFLAAFVSVSHPLAQLGEVSLHELLKYDLILPNRESSVRRIVESAVARDRDALNILQETNYMPTALAMVRNGLGVTILPESAADWSRGDLVRIPIQKPALNRQICVLQRRDRTLSPAAATFVQCLRRQVGSQAKAR